MTGPLWQASVAICRAFPDQPLSLALLLCSLQVQGIPSVLTESVYHNRIWYRLLWCSSNPLLLLSRLHKPLLSLPFYLHASLRVFQPALSAFFSSYCSVSGFMRFIAAMSIGDGRYSKTESRSG